MKIGQKVRHRDTKEMGVVIHSWINEQGDVDNYVAFHGTSWIEVSSSQKPYVLRYYDSSLEEVGDVK